MAFPLFYRPVGCGVSVEGADLVAVAVRVGRRGIEVLGRTEVTGYRNRPRREVREKWSAFMESVGMQGRAAVLCLPRVDTVFRTLRLPAISARDAVEAVALQVGDLHPFGNEEVLHSSAHLTGATAPSGRRLVAVAVVRSERIRSYADALAQAGIRLSGCTVPASALRAALHGTRGKPQRAVTLAVVRSSTLEVYGESGQCPVLSFAFDLDGMTVRDVLRLALERMELPEGEDAHLVAVGDPAPSGPIPGFVQADAEAELAVPARQADGFSLARDVLAYGTAIEAARPRSGLGFNLLPAEQRRALPRRLSPLRLTLSAALVLLAAAFFARPVLQDLRYAERLRSETAAQGERMGTPIAEDPDAAGASQRLEWLKGRSDRIRSDLDLVREMAGLLPQGVTLDKLEITDTTVAVAGLAPDAGDVLRGLENSSLMESARFLGSPATAAGGERFLVEARRR